MKLTLRDLFWLVLVAAVAIMWWRAEQRAKTEAAAADAIFKQLENHLQMQANAGKVRPDGSYSGYSVEIIHTGK